MTTSKTLADWQPLLTPKRASWYACWALGLLTRVAGASLSAFFNPPAAGVVALAADGGHLAYEEAPVDGRPARVVVMGLSGSYPRNELPLPGPAKGDPLNRVAALQWSESDRLVVETTNGQIFSIDGSAGAEKEFASSARALTPREGRKGKFEDKGDTDPDRQSLETAAHRAHVAAFPRVGSRLAVIAVREAGAGREDAPLELVTFDVATGERRHLQNGPLFRSGGRYGFDLQGRIRWKTDADGGHLEIASDPRGWDGWVEVTPSLPGDGRTDAGLRPIGSEADPLKLLMVEPAGRRRIVEFDLKDRATTVLPQPAPSGGAFSPVGIESPSLVDWRLPALVGVRGRAAEPGVYWLDPSLAVVQARIEGQFPGRRVDLLSWTAARDGFAFRVAGGAEPGRLYVVLGSAWDMPIEIARVVDRLSAEDVSPSQRIDLRLGDGAILAGRLTIPASPGLPKIPLVILLGEGDASLGYDARAQAMASQGFAAFAPASLPALQAWPEIIARLSEKGPLDPAKVVVIGAGADRIAQGAGFGYWVLPEQVKGRPVLAMSAPGAQPELHSLDGELSELSPSQSASAWREVSAFLAGHGAASAAPRKGWFWQ